MVHIQLTFVVIGLVQTPSLRLGIRGSSACRQTTNKLEFEGFRGEGDPVEGLPFDEFLVKISHST